jgi:signal peptidase I
MLLLMIKFYAVDIIKVNGYDMKSTLFYGDVLLIQRAFNNYEPNNIVYMRFPARDSVKGKTYGFQRLIGLPGDSIEIRDKKVYRNNFQLQDTSSIQYNYYVKAGEEGLDSASLALFHLNEGGKISEDQDYSFSLTKGEVDGLTYHDAVKKITTKCEQKGTFDQAVFPWSPRYAWNMDNFGKLYIPKKNDTLRLDSLNIELFAVIIRDYEKNTLELVNDSIYIDGKATDTYVVQKNYYFVLGDNRDNANDSRVFGYLPENYLRGKMLRVIRRHKN